VASKTALERKVNPGVGEINVGKSTVVL